MKPLHEFSEVHVGEDCRKISGDHKNGLFFECDFEKLRGLTLKDCTLNRSRFLTSDIKDALGFTLSLQCGSFKGVEYSPLLFDLFLLLASMSSGNDSKRKALLDVIGRERAIELLEQMRGLE
jgi:hypothetical protein